jgi:protoheme IX farnesyltransferase
VNQASPLTAPDHLQHSAAGDDARYEPSLATGGDYISLLKPRVMSLVIFTALVGLIVAPGHIHPVLGFTAILCIAVGAGAAGALNMWYEADIDAVMERTAGRPLPTGRIGRDEALAFGLILSVFSVATMGLMVNVLAAGLLAFTIFFYAVIYTMLLKRFTPQNIVIGGAAGAFPPMIGWAAATGAIGLEPILLFLIIFFWTPPHFWALSLSRADDYARAGIPMLPVVSGAAETKRQILVYSAIMLPVGMSPWLAGFAGATYGVVSFVTGAVMLALAIRLVRHDGALADRTARQLFGFSILYLFALFAVLLIEHSFGLAFGRLPW